MFKDYKLKDWILIAMIAAVSIVIKPYIKMIYLPKGTTGFITMMWVVLVPLIIKKSGAATIFSVLQAMLALAMGIGLKLGIWIIVVYAGPGLVTDLILSCRLNERTKAIIAGGMANCTGTVLVLAVLMKFNNNINMLALIPALISGMLGGVFAYSIKKLLIRNKVVTESSEAA